jgi:Fur family transcriptional regulator, ferric uptake regulator
MSSPKAHRNTLQRQVILEELRKLHTHPTALALHVMVQKRLPKISLGTIYRNLEYLSQIGVIQKLTISGSETHFDAATGPHQHVRCINCDRLADVSTSHLALPSYNSAEMAGYQILGHRLEFFGICPECQQSEAESEESTDLPT